MRGTGFQKPRASTKRREVRLAVITYEGNEVKCPCGWGYFHRRDKVREDAADKHITKHHNGRGIRL